MQTMRLKVKYPLNFAKKYCILQKWLTHKFRYCQDKDIGNTYSRILFATKIYTVMLLLSLCAQFVINELTTPKYYIV